MVISSRRGFWLLRTALNVPLDIDKVQGELHTKYHILTFDVETVGFINTLEYSEGLIIYLTPGWEQDPYISYCQRKAIEYRKQIAQLNLLLQLTILPLDPK